MLDKRLVSVLVILAVVILVTPGASLAQNGAFPVPPGRLVVGDENGLFTLLADGSEKTYLVEENDPACWLRDGAWSPDGERLLYTRICGGDSPTDWHASGRTASVFVYDLADESSSELIPNDGAYQDYAGSWHPDGRQVVIYSNRNLDRYNFYLVNVLTGETSQLTDFDGDVGRVSWDPGGRYLLYNRYVIESDQTRWEVRALDTTDLSEITVAVGLTPRWSPDGTWIAYTTDGQPADVFIMPAACITDGTPCDPDTQARNITYTPTISEREPLWSPDQSQITYLRDTNPEPSTIAWDIYRQDIRTGLLQDLSGTSDVSERQSDWEPVAGQTRAEVSTVLPVVLRVNSGTANLRAQPSTNADVVGVLENGQIIFVQGTNAARDWYRITLPDDGSTAWIFGNLVTTVEGDLDSVPEIPAEE
jgi:Tol biopolymer transport system component